MFLLPPPKQPSRNTGDWDDDNKDDDWDDSDEEGNPRVKQPPPALAPAPDNKKPAGLGPKLFGDFKPPAKKRDSNLWSDEEESGSKEEPSQSNFVPPKVILCLFLLSLSDSPSP